MWLGRRRRSLQAWAAAGALWASACQFPNYNLGREDSSGGSGAFSSAGAVGAGTGGTTGGLGTAEGGTSGAVGATDAGGGTTSGSGGAPGSAGTSGSAGAQASGGTEMGGMASEGGGAGAASDPNLLLEDDFEAGNAAQWLEVAGSPWSVALDSSRASYSYRLTPVFGDFYASVAKAGSWTDQVIEADVEVLEFGGTGTGDVVALLGRFSNIDNYYAAVLRPDGRAAIRARVAGAPPSSIKTSASLGIKVGTWYRLRFELIGTTLRLAIDGQQVAVIDDSSLTRGTVALGGDNSAASFDNVRVTRP